ncbi:DNA mismatch repair protein MutT [Chromobacterium sinusclupearum]|uniref:DNA mismatch repair protein MutT n=1 Tax=Chromobacterium sinusclupearum TaxID=2077146 RepID=A0A2K4MIR2_9NEIS|nr:NUDIX domain-containing protein [Chromobacterium sinusclupearum]POA96963.1 DNA mismatch repair protein MutT [Chromobacterium sinusclupearum]
MTPSKACPLLLQSGKLLWFRHPQAGCQLVKGTIESGETPSQAALRELREEAGIVHARVVKDLGEWEAGYQGQRWSFQLCEVDVRLPDSWTHFCADDGGQLFDFFWRPLLSAAPDDSHPLYHRALAEARRRLAEGLPAASGNEERI